MDCLKSKIESCIGEIERKFIARPDIYLTESDIRCHLFGALKQHQNLSQEIETSDGSYSIPLHTEVRWYGESGRLKYRSDIVVLDVTSLKVRNNLFRLPSKGYSFNKPNAIIEIKLRRRNGKSNTDFMDSIKRDIERLKEIKRQLELPNDFPLYFLIFDKKGNIQSEILAIPDATSIRIKYIFSTGLNAGEQNVTDHLRTHQKLV
jgi:hypothetical protein